MWFVDGREPLIAGVLAHFAERKEPIGGYRIVTEPPTLRHFTAEFEPLGS